jgi:hypothetical protein
MKSPSDLAAGAEYLVSAAVTIWFPCWGVRRKFKLDHKLDSTAQYVRWFVIVICLVLVDFDIAPPGKWAVTIALTFLAFVAWPNLAFYLTQLLRRSGIVRKPTNCIPDA